MDGLFHIGPGFIADEAEVGYAVIQVAQRAAIKKFVYSSVMHPQLGGLLNHEVKLRVEDRLIPFGARFHHPSTGRLHAEHPSRLEEYRGTRGLRRAVERDEVVGLRRLCATCAKKRPALAMTDARFTNATLELCSEGMWSREQIAGLLGKALGRTIHAEATPIADALERLPPDPYLREGMQRMWEHYDRFGFAGGGNALILRTVLGREPTTWQRFLEREIRPRA